jgi:methylmalonyl-CoA/ethylmalonyl-CoA epimerase
MTGAPAQMAPPNRLAALGPVMQLAFVPRDFNAAIAYWTTTMGVGPFFLWEHIQVDRLTYRGETVNVDFSVALAQWGDVQIELIRQDNDAPSIYRDWNSNALHHIQLAVDDYDAALAACEAAGFGLAMDGRGLLGSSDLRFAYCDLGAYGPAGFIEFAYRPPDSAGAFERMNTMKIAALEWDGSDPVRPLF